MHVPFHVVLCHLPYNPVVVAEINAFLLGFFFMLILFCLGWTFGRFLDFD